MRARPGCVAVTAALLAVCAVPALAGQAGSGPAHEAARKRPPTTAARVLRLERQVRALAPLAKRLRTLRARLAKPGPAGLAGARGPVGVYGVSGGAGGAGDDGPSEAFAEFSALGTLFAPNQIVTALSVPAGPYVVFADLVVNNPTAAPIIVECRVTSGPTTVLDTAQATLAASGGADTRTLVLTGAGQLAAGAFTNILCTGSGASWVDADLIALRVGELR